MHRLPLALSLLLLLPLLPGDAVATTRGKSHSRLLKDWLKAKPGKKKDAAWQAILESEALDPGDVEDLRDDVLAHFAKTRRRVPKSGRNEWFDEKKDGWKGLFFASGGSRRGLILALHGGGAGSGDAGSSKGSFGGTIASLKMSGLFPEVLEKTEYGWTKPSETERWVLERVKRARVSWGVDPDRVYVTGHSMGGYGTWTYGSIYADVFAGGAAFAGAPTVYWKAGKKDVEMEAVLEGYLPNLYNIPLFVYQSLDDPNVPAAANVGAMKELKALHESDPRGWKHVYEEVNGRGHAFPKKGPKPGLEWVLSHPRNPRPEKIVWQPTRTWKTTFYWLRWTDPWRNSILTATVDRERNAVDIVIEKPRAAGGERAALDREDHVRTLSVYLDDRVLDMTKECTVTVDGKVRHRGKPVLRLETLIRSCDEREDPRYAFAAEAVVGDVQEGATTTGTEPEKD
ncbi:MAG: hypothetical protein ACYTG4_05595 [Planctomycetota bacterium]